MHDPSSSNMARIGGDEPAGWTALRIDAVCNLTPNRTCLYMLLSVQAVPGSWKPQVGCHAKLPFSGQRARFRCVQVSWWTRRYGLRHKQAKLQPQ